MTKLDILRIKHGEYLKSLGFSKRTVKDYGYLADRFIKYLKESGIREGNEISREMIHQYQLNAHYEVKKDGTPLAIATQRRRMEAVKSFCRYLVKGGHLLYDPARDRRCVSGTY